MTAPVDGLTQLKLDLMMQELLRKYGQAGAKRLLQSWPLIQGIADGRIQVILPPPTIIEVVAVSSIVTK